MPPKRKRAEDATPAEPTTTRSTRSSGRAKAAEEPAVETATKKTTAKKATGAKAKAKAAAPAEDAPAPKKAKTTAKTTAAKSKTTKTKAKAGANTANSTENTSSGQAAAEPDRDLNPSTDKAPSAALNGHAAKAPAKDEPYSAARADALFATYADAEDADMISPEGFGTMCEEAGIPMEGALPLILSWQLDAADMGEISREQWRKGTAALQISSLAGLKTCLVELEDLLLLGKTPVPKASKAPYNRGLYYGYAQDRKAAFGKLYTFCFALGKQGESRNVHMDIASAFWGVLLGPQYPLVNDLLQYIAEKGTYKIVTKDVWAMTLEFCETTKPDLSDYDEAGAWPSMIDEFVAWKKEKSQ